MRESIPKLWLFSRSKEKYTCDLCGRSEIGDAASYCPVWEEYGFVRVFIGITRRSYLVCRSHRDKELEEFEAKVK